MINISSYFIWDIFILRKLEQNQSIQFTQMLARPQFFNLIGRAQFFFCKSQCHAAISFPSLVECFMQKINNANYDSHHPKSAGSDVRDMSFNPNIVKLLSCENPAGSFAIGFELKSAICRRRKWRISSGMSGISEMERKLLEFSKTLKSQSWMNQSFGISLE